MSEAETAFKEWLKAERLKGFNMSHYDDLRAAFLAGRQAALDEVKLNMICEWCEHGRSVSPLHRADVACGKGRGLRRYNNHCKHFNRMSLDNIKLEGDHE